MTIRVRHLIAALESIAPAAEVMLAPEDVNKSHVYPLSVAKVIEMLKDESVFYHDDAIISFE